MTLQKMSNLFGITDLNEYFEVTLNNQKARDSVIQLVVDNSLWIDPIIYESVQVVFPKTMRKRGKQKRGEVDGEITIWNNEPAKWAFWNAMGLSYSGLKNSYICHIYEGSVTKPEHFTNLANMVAFPRAIQSLSEWPPINEILKYRSYELYNYTGPDDKIPEKPDHYEILKFRMIDISDEKRGKIIERLMKTRERKPGYNYKSTSV